MFHTEVISKHAVVFTLVPSAWIGENLVALWRDGRLSNFHTYLSRAAAVAMELFIGALLVVGEQPALLFVAAGLVLVATLAEFLLMWLLPEWTADMRGVYWILKQRRETGTEKANSGRICDRCSRLRRCSSPSSGG